MEQKTKIFIIVGIVASSVISLIAIGLVVFLMKRTLPTTSEAPVLVPSVTSSAFINKGFIGMLTAAGIKTEGDAKILELRGHSTKEEIPGYEPVRMDEKDIQSVRVNKETKITKITKGGVGQEPTVEEVSYDNFAAAPAGSIYLARYELVGSNEVQAGDPVTYLEVYVGFPLAASAVPPKR